MKRVFYGVALLVLAQPALAQTVLDSDFTISVPNGENEPVIESTTLVPLLSGTCYTWHLRLGKVKGDVTVTELYTLPTAPLTWGISAGSGIVVSEDRLSATSTLAIQPCSGVSGWCVSEGDPEGDYSFEIKAGEQLLHSLEFELRAM